MDPVSAFGLAGGISGSVGSLASGIIGAATSRSQMRYQAALQRTNQKWVAQNLPAYQRQGLEAAGYNPLLALGNGASGGSSPIQIGDQGDFSGLGDGLAQTGKALADAEARKALKKEEENKDKLFEAQMEQIKATTNNINTHSAQRSLENKILQNKIDDHGSIFAGLNHFKRGAGDLVRSAWNLYNDNIGQPFANMVNKGIKKVANYIK